MPKSTPTAPPLDREAKRRLAVVGLDGAARKCMPSISRLLVYVGGRPDFQILARRKALSRISAGRGRRARRGATASAA